MARLNLIAAKTTVLQQRMQINAYKSIKGMVFLFLFFVGSNPYGWADVRTWTSGKHVVDAELIGVTGEGKSAKLRRSDNDKEITIPLDKLSQEDRDYIAETQKKKETSIPLKKDEPAKKPKQDLYSAEVIFKQIDALINDKSNFALSFGPRLILSKKEKKAVIDYLILLQKTKGEKYDQYELGSLLGDLRDVKNSKKLDVYVINQIHINIKRELASTCSKKSNAATNMETKKQEDRMFLSFMKEAAVLESMLPESNKLSGNTHNAEEKRRLDKTKHEKATDALF